MKSFFATAVVAATSYAQSIEATAAALQMNCCGPTNLSCACTDDMEVSKRVRVCTPERRTRTNTKMVMESVNEQRVRQVQRTVMVPYTVDAQQIRTAQKPYTELQQRMRIDNRISHKVWYETVSEQVRVPVPVPGCACYSATCSCAGQSGCGCCAPKCGCAPAKVAYTIQTVTKQIPHAQVVRTPVTVPYQEKVELTRDEHILHNVQVTKMEPRVVMEEIIEQIPVYKLVPKDTIVEYFVDVCEDVLVSEGVRPVVKQLTFEEVHQNHEGGVDEHKHAGYSASTDVANPANPNMHSHTIHTNALALHVSGSD